MQRAKAKVKVPSKSMCKKVNTLELCDAQLATPRQPIPSNSDQSDQNPTAARPPSAIHSTMKSKWMMGEMKMEFLMSCCRGKGQTSCWPNNGAETKRWKWDGPEGWTGGRGPGRCSQVGGGGCDPLQAHKIAGQHFKGHGKQGKCYRND